MQLFNAEMFDSLSFRFVVVAVSIGCRRVSSPFLPQCILLLLLLSKVGVVSLITLVVDTKYFFLRIFCYVTYTLFASHTRSQTLWLALF